MDKLLQTGRKLEEGRRKVVAAVREMLEQRCWDTKASRRKAKESKRRHPPKQGAAVAPLYWTSLTAGEQVHKRPQDKERPGGRGDIGERHVYSS